MVGYQKPVKSQEEIDKDVPFRHNYTYFVAESLAIKINSNNNIKGISINENEIKNIQHADDLTIALNNEASIKHALDTIHELSEHAGSNINKT